MSTHVQFMSRLRRPMQDERHLPDDFTEHQSKELQPLRVDCSVVGFCAGYSASVSLIRAHASPG